MAELKKTATDKAAAKDVTVKTEAAAPVAAKAESKPAAEAAKKDEAAPVVKKKPGRKPGSKTKKTAEKKAPAAKKAAAEKKAPVKRRAKNSITLEWDGRSLTEESLVQSAKDVWQYDLGRDVKDFKSVELYIKPADQAVYYVINGDVTGSFGL
ncbi:MAG: DUF6465 family protein [Clostridium sp.]|nr:DUF6465 family protein [Clostridium sp.]